jgi:citrate lyase beta subunit
MDIYYFVKYNNETNFKHIQKYAKTNAILCFDFEDSIKSWINPGIDSELQKQYRNYFKWIYENLISQISSVKIGLRINNNYPELKKDIRTISTFRINSILIPKVETSTQIRIVEELLSENKVIYNELIPIIESSKGIFNLSEIIESSPQKISKIGFGHCDYNFSSDIFPFFHQNSQEYWKWITKISSIAVQYNIEIINSPYLELENSSFFQSMLFHLDELFGENFGQFTLTTKQTVICNTFKLQKKQHSFNKLLDSRLDLYVPEQFAIELVNKYESENNNKGFTVSKADRILISPQEYLSAKSYITKNKLATINFTFVGGCFPVQHNILFEDLFHQKLRRKLENLNQVKLNINIIRYERFNTCLSKIITYHKSNPIDMLVFHIRPEPFLRLVKFYYKYLNNNGKLKHSLNIPLLKIINPENYDLLISGRRFERIFKQNDSRFHKRLVDLNYKTGNFFGNTKYALKKYFELVSNIINYCHSSTIKIIILGPALRSNTSFEPILCQELNGYIKNRLNDKNIAYIDGLDKYSDNFESLFHSNGIHAKETYHELISDKLYNEFKKEKDLICNPESKLWQK